VSLKLARERRDEARQQLAQGLNPQLERKARKAALGVLLKDVAEEWPVMVSEPPAPNHRTSDKRLNTDPQAAMQPVARHRAISRGRCGTP